MRQFDITRATLALSAARAEMVLLITTPTTGADLDDGLLAVIGAHFGDDPALPLRTTGSVTLMAQTVSDLTDMRAFVQDLRTFAAGKPRLRSTATMFSGGIIIEYVAGSGAPWPLGIEPEIEAWRARLARTAA